MLDRLNDGLDSSGAGVFLDRRPHAARLVLRVRGAEDDPVGTAAGFDLGGAINTVMGGEERFAARLGPDEWLLVAEGPSPETLAEDVASDLEGRMHSVVDVSERNVALWVEGSEARVVLNAGIPLDLDDSVFPEGTATRTHCGKAEVVLLRISGAAGYRVECWRSFSPYVFAYLTEAALEFA